MKKQQKETIMVILFFLGLGLWIIGMILRFIPSTSNFGKILDTIGYTFLFISVMFIYSIKKDERKANFEKKRLLV
jgi:hypothetical protein